MSTNSKKHGGHRTGAGRKVRLHLRFAREDARTIYLLTKMRRANSGNQALTEEQVVMDLVGRAWEEIDREYEAAAELAAKGEAFIL